MEDPIAPMHGVFLINTEGATYPLVYEQLIGATPAQVTAKNNKPIKNRSTDGASS
ncbi:hypothetical protein [Bradyrhizobium japonicum]|uniref:hypothetical protein n=1 Tax=Bradyrhizobium japonicum TaxID=375 RepID=UPI00137478B2|nr:hypothetical protein [Bradyrhizobium japonicum]